MVWGYLENNQRLIFENYFTAYETAQYASRKPYDFNAGGKGFDLIRIRIFSERYHFKLKMSSKRCPHLTSDQDSGPGSIAACEHCKKDADCLSSGTTMTVLVSVIKRLFARISVYVKDVVCINSNFEYSNSKQIRMSNAQMTKIWPWDQHLRFLF